MVPFVRTVDEARKVIELLAAQGLERGKNGLRVIMMCEIPSNALLADAFLEHFDGFSIGSNDMTQLTLGLDRDSGIVAGQFDCVFQIQAGHRQSVVTILQISDQGSGDHAGAQYEDFRHPCHLPSQRKAFLALGLVERFL